MITFHRTRPRLWRGNGMGVEPAHYEVRRDGIPLGALLPSAAYGWSARLGDGVIRGETIAEAKRKIRALLEE